MADPITWGLLNLIKKRVKGVQTTLDGVSDKVSGLPDSLDADFTEVKNALDSVKMDTETKLPNKFDTGITQVRNDIAGVKKSVDAFPESFTEVKNAIIELKNDQPISTDGSTAKFLHTSSSGTVVNITGKGKLYFAGFAPKSGDNSRSLNINLDGKSFNISDKGGWSSNVGFSWIGYVCARCFDVINEFIGNWSTISNYDYICGVGNISSTKKTAISGEPLTFKQSLTITSNKSENFFVMYELE